MTRLFVFFILLDFYSIKNIAQNIDYQILKNIEKWRSPSDNDFQKGISNVSPYMSAGIPIIMFGVGILNKDQDLRRKGMEVGIAFGVTVAETYILKKWIGRARPYMKYPDLIPLSYETSKSFPSGHTSAAFSLATSLSLNYRKWYVVIPAYIFAGATAYSRLYLGVHYPSDVLGGAILGSATAFLTYKINQKWQLKKKR